MNLITIEQKTSMVWPPLHRELEALGHTLFRFELEEKVRGWMNWNGGYMLDRLRMNWAKIYATIANKCPDAIMVINNLGIINGPLIQWCEDNRTPLLVWYMDDPLYLRTDNQWKNREYLYCFCYCKAHGDRLREWGVRNVRILETATDEKQFKLDPTVERDLDVVFVGNTGVERIQSIWHEMEENLGKSAWRSAQHYFERMVSWGGEELRKRGMTPFEFCDEAFDGHNPIWPWVNKVGSLLASQIDLVATYIDRKEVVLGIAKEHPIHVYGDKFWGDIKKDNDCEGLDSNSQSWGGYISYLRVAPICYNI